MGASCDSSLPRHASTHASYALAISASTAARRPAFVPARVADGFDELAHAQPGVRQQGMSGGVVPVQVRLVVGELDDGPALGQGQVHLVLGQARSHGEDNVGPVQEPAQHGRGRRRGCADGERVGLGERALAEERCRGGRTQHLGQLDDLVRRSGPEDALSGQYHRRVGVGQGAGGALHVSRVGERARRRDRLVTGLADVQLGDVSRQLDHHGARPAVAQPGKGAPHRVLRLLGDVDGLEPLGDIAVAALRGEVAGPALAVARVPRRQHEERRRVRVGCRHAGERVLGARPRLHRKHPDLRAVAHAAGDRPPSRGRRAPDGRRWA